MGIFTVSSSALAAVTILLTVTTLNAVIVKVQQGLVSGTTETLYNGKVVDKFSLIPYARPPVGKLRFKEPEPLKSWPGVWNASDSNGKLVQCLMYVQKPGGPYSATGHEDCLYLSVYTTKVSQNELLDVVVFIHGGAFMFGSGYIYEPLTLLANQDMVYVNLNYRLGPLGFLSTGDNVVPGNMGLKDQIVALRWIKENIKQFGGNPESITISGMSAGGASVHFMMLAPTARGLFHKAISMSGTGLCPWAIAENLPDKTKIIAHHLGCPTDNNEKMVECLRTRPASSIVDASRLNQAFMYNPFSPWAPTVDRYAKNPILTDYPAELIKQGKVADVPWLDSVTTAEGLYPGAEFLVSEETMKTIDANWTNLAPHILDFNHSVPESLKTKTAEEIRTKYLGDKPITKENHEPFIEIMSDRMFNVDAERAARFQSAVTKSPVYFYKFNFRGRYSVSNVYSRSLEDFGVSHGDDTQYVIQRETIFTKNIPENETKMIDLMTNLWASFAKTGRPHLPNWKPVQPDSFNYLQINSADDLKFIEDVPEIGSRTFWDSLPIDEKTVWKPSSSATPRKEL